MESDRTTSSRGPYAKTAMIHRQILDACEASLREVGYRATTMAEVARRAGLSHNGLLHHFPSKDALFVAVLDDLDSERLVELATDPGDNRVAHPGEVMLEALRRTLAGADETFLSTLELTLIAEAMSSAHPVHASVSARMARTGAFLTRAFSDLADQGRLAAGIGPDEAASMTLAVLQGLMIQRAYGWSQDQIMNSGSAFFSSLGVEVPTDAS